MGLILLGLPLGTVFGAICGGYIAQHHGWRVAFVAMGLPGLIVAALVALALREPVRALSDDLRRAEDLGVSDDDGVEGRLVELARRPDWLKARKGLGAMFAPGLPRSEVISARDGLLWALEDFRMRADADLAARGTTVFAMELVPRIARGPARPAIGIGGIGRNRRVYRR